MIATVDWGKIAELAWAALLAGVAVTACFALVIHGVARAGEARRDARSGAAAAYTALAGVAGLAFAAGVVFGLGVIIAK